MKRYLAFLSIILVAGLLLVACGGEDPTPTPEPEPTAAPVEEPTEAPTEEPTEEPTPEPTAEPAEEPMVETRTIYVGPELAECTGVAPQQCLQIKDSPDGEYELWYSPIEGFEFEEGFEYELVVEVHEDPDAPADASTINLVLVEEVSKTPVEMAEEPMDEGMVCETDHTGEVITIYQSAGLTGALATILGQGFINGTADAVDHINETGGVCGAEFEIRLEDSQYDPEQELAIYQQFRAEDPPPLLILTYGSGASIVLKDLVIEDEIPNLAAGLNAQAFYVPRDGYTVGVAPIYSDQFAGFLQWAHDNWADIKPEEAGDDIVVGVIGWDSAFGTGATTDESLAFAEELGVTVLPIELQEISPTADVTGQLQNLLLGGANVIYVQSLSFGPAQVIGTLQAMGAWDQVVTGGVNWSINTDVAAILGENAALMDGYYGVFPYNWWNDTDLEGVQQALEDFEAGGYPETDKAVGYLLSYGSIFALQDIIAHAINTVGFENLSGKTFFDAMKDLGTVSAGGLYTLDVRDGNRAPNMAQIRQAQLNDDGQIEFVVVEDFVELPDTRPPAE